MRRANSAATGMLGVLLLAGCAQPMTQREKGALGGAALGAGTGAIIGSTRGDAAEGAAIGGALGALGGGLVGHQLETRDQQARAQEEALQRQREEIARNRQLLEELRRRDLDARETSRGVVVNLPDVLFEFGRADLTPSARRKVADIAQVLRGPARGRRVSVEGHTDSVGSDEANQRLSEARAASVASALVREGVSSPRLETRGFGERYPVAPNTVRGRDNPEGRAKNRRVEVIIENEAARPAPRRPRERSWEEDRREERPPRYEDRDRGYEYERRDPYERDDDRRDDDRRDDDWD